jgi:hypothetical protein
VEPRRERERRTLAGSPKHIVDLEPHLLEELSADNGLISPSHVIYSFSDIRALSQRSLAHGQVRFECVKAQSLQSQDKISIGRNPPTSEMDQRSNRHYSAAIKPTRATSRSRECS